MTDTPKTVFVTKYALTEGILEGELLGFSYGATDIRCPSAGIRQGFEKDDYHLTREAAVTRANAMRDTKLASLHQQAERVMGLRF